VSAWLSVGIFIKPYSGHAVLVVVDAIDLLGVAIAERRELPEILKLVFPRYRHHPRITVEAPTLICKPSELFRVLIGLVAWYPSPARLEESLLKHSPRRSDDRVSCEHLLRLADPILAGDAKILFFSGNLAAG
jgi:hypothetical protein